MIEKSEEKQIPTNIPTIPERKKTKSLRSRIVSKYNPRAPSREFSDPIYAGFEGNEDNNEYLNWGPWIVQNEPTLRNSHSLHTGMKLTPGAEHYKFNSLSVSKKNIANFNLLTPNRSPSRSELPQIKQKGKANFLEIKLGQTDSNDRGNLRAVIKQIKFKPKTNPVNDDKKAYFKKLKDQSQKRFKIGTVVYNYCTNNNVDECLLNYKRSEPTAEKAFKDEMMFTRYQGLKAYWKKRSSTQMNKQL